MDEPSPPASPCSNRSYVDVPSGGTSAIASEFIGQLADMPELIAAIGDPHAKRLGRQAAGVQSSIRAGLLEDIAAEVQDLVYDTALLPLNSPLISEAIAAAFAALAGLMEPDILPEGGTIEANDVIEVLEGVASRVDAFQPFLFSALCRVESLWSCGCQDASGQRSVVALSGACVWLFACLCRALGYHRFTASVLWFWADGDALWIAVLAKGILSLDDLIQMVPETPLNGALCPSDLLHLQGVVAEAVLGLVGADIAFTETLLVSGPEAEEVHESRIRFAKHWTKLAVAVAESDLVGPLLKVTQASSSRSRRVKLASFLAKILQPELSNDPDWIAQHPNAALVVEAARGAAEQIRERLFAHGTSLWALLTEVTSSGRAPQSFLRDCSAIAFRSTVPASEVMCLVRETLCSQTDTKTLASLCVIATNLGVVPMVEDDGGLSSILGMLQPDSRMLVADRLLQWEGVVQHETLACWLAFLQGEELPHVSVTDNFAATAWPLQPSHHMALNMSGLKDLLTGAPPELSCCIDKQLLTNPVRSPYGHTFEYTVLSSTLAQNGNQCPLTGEPLALTDCHYDWQLKRSTDNYINDWMHRVKWQQPES
eukprot:TRINITY_DN21880_c0_g1_i1.p1 TRINITY_DN21880_c0_g1~~TRINITY_DN21880_c0_g1_i1.p1  ORF type:complete len:599 (-),score=81.99 TRINITY_DN21880_c0_g1_i1:402-2198(-)